MGYGNNDIEYLQVHDSNIVPPELYNSGCRIEEICVINNVSSVVVVMDKVVVAADSGSDEEEVASRIVELSDSITDDNEVDRVDDDSEKALEASVTAEEDADACVIAVDSASLAE